jgi:hypothetical protein
MSERDDGPTPDEAMAGILAATEGLSLWRSLMVQQVAVLARLALFGAADRHEVLMRILSIQNLLTDACMVELDGAADE